MSFSTQAAFVHEGDWDSVTDSHPAMKFMADFTRMYDARETDKLWKEHCTSDYVYSKSTGEIFPPGKESWDAAVATYAPFTSYYHEPYFLICWERDDGWEMTGNAWLYANLPGEASGGSPCTDLKGNKWQIRVPGGFHFTYRKEGGDIKLGSMAITSDSGPIVVQLLQRGVMKPADLGL